MDKSMTWRKSSFSGPGETNDCVELAATGSEIRLRESDAPTDVITITPAGLGTFIRGVKAGTLDQLGR
ncbi:MULTISPECIES: DUF397 domain-containing protein [Streptomyces]|uniref:DUF397 domain-containing protein n=1 Tax=Streptomyces TaxID=1883 RepID=UPI000A3BB3C7|nr:MULTISPECIES: DUF397 domain-containing protein [Streptomyces]RSS38431.1 DUF397 domain-containing protein [Streptomyces sp. WAC05858]WTB04914.1 DUF397 domain-containing protein [Streptomyces antimycoticus]